MQGEMTKIRDNTARLEMDRRLDEALRMTFPASDPIAITIEPARRLDRPLAVTEVCEMQSIEAAGIEDTAREAG